MAFPGNCKVLKANGEWEWMRRIQEGDEVFGVDVVTLEARPAMVLKRKVHRPRLMWQVEAENGLLIASLDQCVLTVKGEAKQPSWVSIEDILKNYTQQSFILMAPKVLICDEAVYPRAELGVVRRIAYWTTCDSFVITVDHPSHSFVVGGYIIVKDA